MLGDRVDVPGALNAREAVGLGTPGSETEEASPPVCAPSLREAALKCCPVGKFWRHGLWPGHDADRGAIGNGEYVSDHPLCVMS